MLVPDGVPNLKAFQRRPFLNFDYTSSVDAFYVNPENNLAGLGASANPVFSV